MILKFNFTFSIEIEDCKLNTLILTFKKIRKNFINSFIQQVLLEFAEYYMNENEKPFGCEKCGNNKNFK